MNKEAVYSAVRAIFPEAAMGVDENGQLLIYTNTYLKEEEVLPMLEPTPNTIANEPPPLNMSLIASRCVDECIRQEVGLDRVGWLLGAYDFALNHKDELPTLTHIQQLAQMVETKNLKPGVDKGYRRMPVVFANGSAALNHQEIPDRVERLWGYVEWNVEVDDLVKQWLDIHPYIDGNGRIAFIIYNWLCKTLENPVPLPDFYNENVLVTA